MLVKHKSLRSKKALVSLVEQLAEVGPLPWAVYLFYDLTKIRMIHDYEAGCNALRCARVKQTTSRSPLISKWMCSG